MSLARALLSFALAAVVALSLAWFMYFLTHSSQMRLSASDRVQMLDFVRLKRNEITERKDTKPERPQVSKIPDAPPAADQSSSASASLTVTAPTVFGSDLSVRRSMGLGSGDGEYLPIVKVAPVYPRRASQRGITGTCTVQYTVTTSGTVRDVSLVPGECVNSVFEKPSVEAAYRFKYKPRVIDSQPVEVIGVRNRFYYKQSEDG